MSEGAPSHDDERREAAAAWHVRLQSHDATERDWLDFERWLGEPANRAAYDAIEAAQLDIENHKAAIAAALGASPGAARVTPLRAAPSRPKRSIARWVAAGLAAGAAVAAAVIFAPVLTRPSDQQFAYAAPADSTLAVTFPDSSSAVLNRGASIQVRWSAHERQVTLERGEAAFKVRHDAALPFVVVAGADTIRDVGTEFNVQRPPDELIVTVREGAVTISSAAFSPVTITAGRQLRVEQNAKSAALSQVNADDAFAWQSGRLVYHDAPLSRIVADINGYRGTPVRIGDTASGHVRFSGVLMIGPSANMVEQLLALLPLRSEQGKEEIVIRSR